MTDATLPAGLWFEDLEPGRVVHTRGRTVTEADLMLFAGLSGDFNPLHVDETAAARTPFRGRVAHGLLVQSIASGLAVQTGIFHGTLAALAGMDIEYVAPVRPGDTLRARLEVAERAQRPGPRRGKVTFAVRVLNQDDAVVIESRWHAVVSRRR